MLISKLLFKNKIPSSIQGCNLGFSLIELMIVIVITAMISVVAIPNYKAHINKAKVTQAIAMIDFCKNDVYQYFIKNGSFPNGTDPNQTVNCQGQVLSSTFVLIPAITATNPENSDNPRKVQVNYTLNNTTARFTLVHQDVKENNSTCNIFIDLINNNGDIITSCSTNCVNRSFFPVDCRLAAS